MEESKFPTDEQRRLQEKRAYQVQRKRARTAAAMLDVKSTLSLGAVMLAGEIVNGIGNH